MLASIADSKSHPFIWLCYENDLDMVQVDEVLNLISKAENAFSTPDAMSYFEFEQAIEKIVPSKKANADFAKAIIRALNSEDKFILGAKRFKEDGIII